MNSQTEIVDDQFVAYRVRFELGRQDKTQRALATELDVSEFYLSRRVRGEVPFSAVELAQVAEILGVDITVFFPPPVGCAS